MDIGDSGSDALGLPVSSFSVKFPLPYRVLFLLGLGGVCWASNLHILDLAGIDTSTALQSRPDSPVNVSRPRHPYSDQSYTPSHTIYTSVYKIVSVYSGLIGLSWVLFSLSTGADRTRLDEFRFIPTVTTVGLLFAATVPLSSTYKVYRSILYQSLWRCFTSSPAEPVHFSDVIIADVLTSFAKVLGDLWIFGATLLPGGSLQNQPKIQGLSEIAIPLLMSLPYAVRLRQCIVEYMGSVEGSRRPLYNAAKYATAFPVILLSASQRLIVDKDEDNTWRVEYPLFRMWVLAVLVNSVYSFWWDVTNDWGLSLLSPYSSLPHRTHKPVQEPHSLHKNPSSHDASTAPSSLPDVSTHVRKQSAHDFLPINSSPPGTIPESSSSPSSSTDHQHHHAFVTPSPQPAPGLRHPLLFQDPMIYYLAVFFNFLLRFTWSLKLSSHLHTVADLESGVFLMEALELIRRWMWVFLRIEWEVIRMGHGGGAIEQNFIASGNGDGILEMSRMRPEAQSILP